MIDAIEREQRLRHIRLDMQHGPGILQQADHLRIRARGPEAARRDPNARVVAVDVETVLHADGQAVQRAPQPARAFEVGVEDFGAGERGREERFRDAVGELVGQAGALAEGGADLHGRVLFGAEAMEQGGGAEGGVGDFEVEWGEDAAF